MAAELSALVEQLRYTPQSAKHKVPVLTVLLTTCPHVPAHTGIDQRMRCDEPNFDHGRVQRNVFSL